MVSTTPMPRRKSLPRLRCDLTVPIAGSANELAGSAVCVPPIKKGGNFRCAS
jgi:hypothetical protein